MKLFEGGRVLPILLFSNLGSSLVEFGESTRDCSPGHAGKEGPHLAMSGESRGFSRIAAGVSSFDGEFRFPPVLAHGSPIFHSSCEGELGSHSSHCGAK